MKKILILAVMMLPVLSSCHKERVLDDEMEGQSNATDDDYGLSQKELNRITNMKKEIMMEIKRGDSLTVVTMRHELDSLKEEIHKLKEKK